EHLAAAATLFRNIFDRARAPYPYSSGPFSPSSMSLSSHPPTPSSTTRKKSRLPKNKKPPLRRPTMGTREDLQNMDGSRENNNKGLFSIIRNREDLNDGYQSNGPLGGMPSSSYQESSDEFYSVVSDSDIVNNERYRNDAKLRKRCAVVITPTKELIQYERKRDQMYNEILLKQRRKLELRALEKQREKERRRLGRREEHTEQTKGTEKGDSNAAIQRDRDKKLRRKSRSYTEIFMSSESEFETNFQVRTRRQKQQTVKDLQQPLNIQIEMTEATTNSLLSQIDAHLEKPEKKTEKLQEERPKLTNEEFEAKDIKQKTCDINNDKGQTTKMRELNLLADIAQHLSPYQLDLPETNKTPTPPPANLTEPAATEVAKEKVTVTEHIILPTTFDNLLEKTQTQLDVNEQQQQTATTSTPSPPPSYAHEPKLNLAANYNSSPKAITLPQQENNTPLIENIEQTAPLPSNDSANTKKIDETLEQILEESISVLKSVTSPANLLNESPATPAKAQTPPPSPAPQPISATTIPILISNVKSLNHFEEQQEKDNSENTIQHLTTKTAEIKENVVLKKTKDRIQDATDPTLLSSTILNNSETSLLNADAGDLSNISSEASDMLPQALKVPSLMAADLSDISLESEISKHLPDIAEPSPVVTDMSDNSNESNISKDFNLNNNSTTTTTMAAVMSLPDLPLEMPIVATTNLPGDTHLDSMESNFQNLNSTLNTPTKLMGSTQQQQQLTQSHNNDLNTPLKFPLQPDLENEATTTLPLKNVLEPEADNNVTKFLDLILNKTVTDAESETRDKIIKELNALTADSTATASEASESACNEEITATSPLEVEATAEKSLELENTEETNKTLDLAAIAELEKEEQQQPIKKNISMDSQQTKEVNMENAKETPASANNEDLNPPKENPKEEMNPLAKPLTKSSFSSPLKQTFNIKCRVRLKRLNIDEHCKRSKKETWMAIPLTKTEEVAEKSSNNNEMKNCDNMTMSLTTETTTSVIKKPCLKYNTNSKRASEEEEIKTLEQSTAAADEEPPLAAKKAKLDEEPANVEPTSLATATQQQLPLQSSALVVAPALSASNLSQVKTKTKPLKTVTFDLSNLNEELRDSTSSSTSSSATYPTTKHRSKHHNAHIAGGAMGCYLKNNRTHRKLPDNTLRAAETLQIFVNTINDSTRTPPPAEFNKKRSPIKNKCIAEDETPRPPPASTLMGTPPCKKSCTDKARSQISSTKCKDQLVSSLAAPSISTITSEITTARIYTSSPLDQTLPEYDDNVDTVADTELILPTTTGSLRRKLKRPKKSLTRPEPADDTSTDDISNQPECNGEDDTDAVVDNEDDVFAEELLPIPAANEHILEEIVSARPTHMGTGTVIRDDYMNIEATATVPVYLFNDESRDLATPEPIQSSGDTNTNVVDSSSYLNTSSSPANHNAMATATASTTSSSTTTTALGNLEKSMLSPSEHEVSSTQETFYQTPTKSKQNGENFGEKSSSSNAKDKGGGTGSSCSSMNGSQKLKTDEISFPNKQQEDHTSSTTGLLQNNQVDTTNHSPEMCTLTLTPTTTSTTTSSLTNNRKMRKVSTHDEILFNELQQQQQQQEQQQLQAATNKRKNLSSTTTFCAESTSDHNNCKTKVINKNTLEETSVKSNGSLAKEDKFKKLLKEACKRDKNLSSNELEVMGTGGLIAGTNTVVPAGGGGGGGGSSPSTTTLINEEKISRSKRKKQKSSKSSKSKTHNERCTKIVLKASKLSAHVPATTTNPLIITIPKSRILRPPPTPTPPTPTEIDDRMEEFIDIPNAKLFTEKKNDNGTTLEPQQQPQLHHQSSSKQAQSSNSITKKEWHQSSVTAPAKSKRSHSPVNNLKESTNPKTSVTNLNEIKEAKGNSTSNNKDTKEKSSSATAVKSSGKETETKEKATGSVTIVKKKTKSSSSHSSSSSSATNNHNNNSNNKEIIFVKDKYDLIKNKEKSQQNNDIQENKEKLKEKTNSQQTKTIANTNSSQNRLHKSSTKDKIKEKSSHKSSEKSNNLKFNISLPISHKHTNSSSSSTHSTTSSNKTSNSKTTKNSSNHNSSSSSSSLSSSSNNLSTADKAIVKTKTNLSTTTANATDNKQGTPTSTSTLAGSSTSSSSSSSTTASTVTIATHHVRKKLKTK
ncbi:hypothetical protein FF38_11938, partial [Lucilia cuprina]